MIKKLFLIALFFFTISETTTYAQLKLIGKEMSISNFDTNPPEGVLFVESIKDGPYLYFIGEIDNLSDSPLELCPSKSEITIEFRYLNKTYKAQLFPHNFLEKPKVKLDSKAKIQFEAGVNVFLGTPILKPEPYDYSEGLMVVLPTISLSY